MATSPSDLLFELAGDEIARALLRALLERSRSQKELVEDLALSQSVVSRTLKMLRAAGWVRSQGLRDATLTVCAPQATRQLLLAGDHLAQALLDEASAAQQTRTKADRRLLLNSESEGEQNRAG